MSSSDHRSGDHAALPDDTLVRELLARVYGPGASAASDAFVTQGMIVSELVKLFGLIRQEQSREILEIGMASATSSVVMCSALVVNGGGRLTSVDPFQSDASHFDGAGVRAIHSAGFQELHTLIEAPSFLALPSLVADRKQYDLVFIDGWHSFDFTLVDLFYADLLLRDGGVLAIHDSTAPPVFKAIRFFESHKPYERLSPPLMVELPALGARLTRRLRTAFAGREALEQARARRTEWRMLAAYRKLASVQVDQTLLRDF